jgi:hypothetical protein
MKPTQGEKTLGVWREKPEEHVDNQIQPALQNEYEGMTEFSMHPCDHRSKGTEVHALSFHLL